MKATLFSLPPLTFTNDGKCLISLSRIRPCACLMKLPKVIRDGIEDEITVSYYNQQQKQS